ncbi:hypothetical protein [Kingella kingae]|uniref:hypothetical protein n=1 Tax=Kingella kingae TaxID=504 RepID=UPI00056E3E7A|nr:hypothetical protein [Kingella kingae]
MIFIWGMAVFALVFSLPPICICHIERGSWIYSENYFAKLDDNSRYCRDLQREIAAERRRNT